MLNKFLIKEKITFFLYGHYSEYSLRHIEIYLSSRKIEYKVLANLPDSEIIKMVSGTKSKKVLLTSAHPYIPIKVQEKLPYPTYSYSIAKLRAITDWHRIFFFSHDPLEEFKEIEFPFIKDYDAMFLHHPERYDNLGKHIPLFDFPYPSINSEFTSDLTAIFFPSEWIFYTSEFSPLEFLSKFEFLKSNKIGIKPPYIPGLEGYLEELNQLGAIILDSKTRAEEIISCYEGKLITNSTSGVIQSAHDFGRPIILLRDFPQSQLYSDPAARLSLVDEPFTFDNMSKLLENDTSLSESRKVSVNLDNLDETFRNIYRLS